MNIADSFQRFAKATARSAGQPTTFGLALLIIVAWAVTGPIFGFSDTWQLIINTGTTIVTFLMVFLIQNTQNRDTEAVQVKLDELLRAHAGAHNALMDLEELEAFQAHYRKLAEAARSKMRASESLPFAKSRTAPDKGGSRPAGD